MVKGCLKGLVAADIEGLVAPDKIPSHGSADKDQYDENDDCGFPSFFHIFTLLFPVDYRIKNIFKKFINTFLNFSLYTIRKKEGR